MHPPFVEVFFGHAGLTLKMGEAGLDSLGADYAHNKDKPVTKHIFLDLATKEGQAALLQLIKDRRVCYVHHLAAQLQELVRGDFHQDLTRNL